MVQIIPGRRDKQTSTNAPKTTNFYHILKFPDD